MREFNGKLTIESSYQNICRQINFPFNPFCWEILFYFLGYKGLWIVDAEMEKEICVSLSNESVVTVYMHVA
jgi:hypothetical protein